MKKLFLIPLVLFIASCHPDRQDLQWVCNCSEQQKVSEFITANVKSANNMSDEEMEDVISELRRTGISTNCHQKLMWIDGDNYQIIWTKSKLDSCEQLMF